MKVKVQGTNKCLSCYYGSDYADGCTYMIKTKKSRMIDDKGNKVDARYCCKYKEGRKVLGEAWKEVNRNKYESYHKKGDNE